MKKKFSLKKEYFIYLCMGLFFLFFIYLSIPSLYNFNKLKEEFGKKIYNEFGLKVNITNINYVFLPTPHLKLKNVEILNFSNENKFLSKVNLVKIPINIFSLITTENMNFNSFIISNAIFEIKTEDVKNLNSFYSKKLSNKKIKIKNSKFNIKNEERIISVIEIKNLIANYKDNKNKLITKAKIFNLDINLISNLSFNSNINSNLKIFVPQLGLVIKSGSSGKDKNLKTIIKYPENKIELNHYASKNFIKILESKININFLNGFFDGKINLDPFNFKINFNINELNFSKLISFLFFNFFEIKNIFPISSKLNGEIMFVIKDFNTKLNVINSSIIDLEFKNGAINISQFNLFLNNNDYIHNTGSLIIQNKKKYYVFKTNINFNHPNLIYSRLTIPKKKRIKKINLNIKSIFDFQNNELIIKEINSNGASFNSDTISSINDKINNFFFESSEDEVLNFFNVKALLKSFIY